MLEFLDGQEPEAAPAPVAEPVIEPTPEAPARGDDGKFVSRAPAPDPVVAPVIAPEPAPASQGVPPGYVPVSVVQGIRDEFKAFKAQQAPKPAPEPVAIPDAYADPDGYAAFHQQQTHQATLNIKLDLSEDMARSRHGEDLVDSAKEWALQKMEQSPAFAQEVLSNRNPYEFAVQAFNRDQLVSNLTPADVASFRAWQAAQSGQAPAPIPAAPAAPHVAAPPRSIASDTSAGGGKPGETPVGPGNAFGAIIK